MYFPYYFKHRVSQSADTKGCVSLADVDEAFLFQLSTVNTLPLKPPASIWSSTQQAVHSPQLRSATSSKPMAQWVTTSSSCRLPRHWPRDSLTTIFCLTRRSTFLIRGLILCVQSYHEPFISPGNAEASARINKLGTRA